MQCLICDGPAEDITPGGFEGVIVDCPRCKPYEVAGSVQRKLSQRNLERRIGALRKAQRFAAPETRPAIDSMTF